MSPLVRMSGISKSFSGVPVLSGVQLDVDAGEVHALMGANGAGKSTLMKILTGVYTKDAGSIELAGPDDVLRKVEIGDAQHARELGIGIVYQELNLISTMSVVDNINLGREPLRARGLLLDRARGRQVADRALAAVGAHIDPSAAVATLSAADQQLVEIAKCLATESRIIILDEPTTSLSSAESEALFTVMQDLKSTGIGIIYISHRMEEIFRLADRITVMRDGQFVGTYATSDLDRNGLVRAMLGRTLSSEMSTTATGPGLQQERSAPPALRVRGVRTRLLRDVSIDVHTGEIVGMFGLVGAGRTELARAVFGVDHRDAGSIEVHGSSVRVGSPADAVAAGLALVPEDRKTAGLVLELALGRNIELAALAGARRIYWSGSPEKRLWDEFGPQMHIVARHRGQQTRQLSGGNQQKVVLAKWLAVSPRILILDEPTRGIDIGAKHDIYVLIRSLAASGVAILLISSEIEEVTMLSDRVTVMHEGELVMDVPNVDLDHHTILSAAMGGAA